MSKYIAGKSSSVYCYNKHQSHDSTAILNSFESPTLNCKLEIIIAILKLNQNQKAARHTLSTSSCKMNINIQFVNRMRDIHIREPKSVYLVHGVTRLLIAFPQVFNQGVNKM